MDPASILRDVASRERAVELAVLFGSHARDAARRESDVDLGVRWAEGTTRAERNEVIDRLERVVRAPLDVTDLDEAPPLLRMEIARGGVVLVERTAGVWSRFRARAMLDWWDFAPYARRVHRAARARLEGASRGSR